MNPYNNNPFETDNVVEFTRECRSEYDANCGLATQRQILQDELDTCEAALTLNQTDVAWWQGKKNSVVMIASRLGYTLTGRG